MAFLLRNITHSAEGREIVRTSRVDDDLLKIGRDPDCDIRLNDLAVALHHATIEQVSASRLGVSAEAGPDGRAQRPQRPSSARSTSPPAATIRIGPFLLRVMPPRAGLGRRRDRRRARRRRRGRADKFDDAPLRARLGDARQARRSPGLLALLVLGLFLAWPIWSFYRRSAAEADAMPRASTPTGCGQRQPVAGPCRARATIAQPATSSRSRRCATTPARPATPTSTTMPIRAGWRGRRRDLGRWRRRPASPSSRRSASTPGRCVDCHTEHEGPQQMPPTPQHFCADCHADLDARLPDTRLADAARFRDGSIPNSSRRC